MSLYLKNLVKLVKILSKHLVLSQILQLKVSIDLIKIQ